MPETPRMEQKMKDILTAICDVRDAFNRLEKTLSGGPAKFYFERMAEIFTGIFSLAKFQIGDACALVKDIDCSDKPGWRGSEHYLKAGCTAIISDIDFYKSGFRYGIVFDKETWIDRNGVERPVSTKHEFWFAESDLRHAK